MMTFGELIGPFLGSVAAGEIDIYNEFSLQHELGIFLRSVFPTDRVQFERNVRHFFPCGSFTKKEIDIVVIGRDSPKLQWQSN